MIATIMTLVKKHLPVSIWWYSCYHLKCYIYTGNACWIWRFNTGV